MARQAWRSEELVELSYACRYSASPARMEAVERLRGRNGGQSIYSLIRIR
jgi:hypothetical protein